jgi:glycosyltransferase involved in cell wall biosynthesis
MKVEHTALRYSLLVPCYNAENYIDGFLRNVAQLAVPFDELIFYDDASTDNTLQILTQKGLTVVSCKTNKGPGFARNRLAQQAKGDYIHFHDIDDEFNTAFLALVNDKLQAQPADVILGNADWIDAATRQLVIKWQYDETEMAENPLAYFINKPLGIINTVYKKHCFLKAGGFNEEIKCWEDADLHVRLAASGASFAVINEVIAYSLRHNNGISSNQKWCWGCRLGFLADYLALYYSKVDKTVFEAELLKVQNGFTATRQYHKLGEVISLNKKYGLSLNTAKISGLFMLDKVFGTQTLIKMLSVLRLIKGKI